MDVLVGAAALLLDGVSAILNSNFRCYIVVILRAMSERLT
jgi:hypothetical protein